MRAIFKHYISTIRLYSHLYLKEISVFLKVFNLPLGSCQKIWKDFQKTFRMNT